MVLVGPALPPPKKQVTISSGPECDDAGAGLESFVSFVPPW